MSSTEGSEIITGWKRRSSAASFSMYLRYSSIVVAPMVCNSPRASAGLSMLPASIDPSPPDPAPTMVCNSSMNRMSSSECSRTSSSTLVSRSSNSPRYFAPATIELMSSAITRRPASVDGTSPLTMRCARPSTIAVFPTPGSPISTGLFLRRRERISMVSSISSLRPTTGSTLPSLACSVRSRPYSSSVGVSDCAAGLASALRPSSIPARPSTLARPGCRTATSRCRGVRARAPRIRRSHAPPAVVRCAAPAGPPDSDRGSRRWSPAVDRRDRLHL